MTQAKFIDISVSPWYTLSNAYCRVSMHGCDAGNYVSGTEDTFVWFRKGQWQLAREFWRPGDQVRDLEWTDLEGWERAGERAPWWAQEKA